MSKQMLELDELDLLIQEYDPEQPDWSFRKSVMMELISRIRPATLRSSAVSMQPLRRCSYCKTWHSKPCGEQCHWNPTDPTAPPHTEPQAAPTPADEMRSTAAELRSTSNGNCNAIAQAMMWERKAAEWDRSQADTETEGELVATQYELAATRAALEPFAKIGLWRDQYPDAKEDRLTARQLQGYIKIEDVRRAREALALTRPQAGSVK